MEQLNNCLITNKISLNVEKNELVFFNSRTNILPDEIKIILTGKRLYPSNSVKYFGERIDKFLQLHHQMKKIAVKLIITKALLPKLRN